VATKSSIEWTELSWNSTVGCTKISLDYKNGYVKSEQGCGNLMGLVTTAPQETRVGCQNSLGMSGTREMRRHGLPKQLIDD
jgi:protein gp37